MVLALISIVFELLVGFLVNRNRYWMIAFFEHKFHSVLYEAWDKTMDSKELKDFQHMIENISSYVFAL